MRHYALSRQERSQLNGGRWFEKSAPLCGTGDGHWRGTHPDEWNGVAPPVTCERCIALKHLIAPRERNRIEWNPYSTIRVAVLSLSGGLNYV